MAVSIAFDSQAYDGSAVASGADLTIPLTVASAAGQERLVFVAGIGSDPAEGDFSAVTIDGQPATRIGTVSKGAIGGGARAFVTAWRAIGTANTSINVVATFGGSFDTCYGGYCACYKLSNADTVLATTNAGVNDPTLSTNTVTGGAAAAMLFGFSDGLSISVAWTGLTEDFDTKPTSDSVYSAASANIATGATPRTISANITPDLSDGDDSVASICVSFNPDAAAPPSTDENLMDKSGMTTMGGMMG